MRQQKETKERLIELEDLYKKKRELQSIGIEENNTNKIKNMYNRQDMRKKIEKKVIENKKKTEMKNEKDKIIKEQLEKVEKFLKESKCENHKKKKVPENHYSMLI